MLMSMKGFGSKQEKKNQNTYKKINCQVTAFKAP